MKTSIIRLLSLILAVIPINVVAQNNIQKAFDAIIKCPEAQITGSNSLQKDPSTGKKTAQSDVYRFVLPSNKAKLLKNVMDAFDKDAEMAFSVNKGKSLEAERDILLAVGDGSSGSVQITSPGCEYIYSLYLAPQSEDSEGIYRYAYGMSYKEEGGSLVGKLVVTYATTLKHRQEAEQQRQNNMIRSFSNGAYVISGNDASQASWFDILTSYFQRMTQANSQTRISLASRAFKVIRDTSKYPEVTEADKDAIREILKGMVNDKKYSETVVNKLLNQCLVELK